MNRLKCELCLKGCLPPLRICEGGHLMCPECSELMEDHCLSCQQPILMARHTLLNNVANKLYQLEVLQQELAELLECPVCYCRVMPPLKLCTNGHAVCSKCRQFLHSCPYCCDKFMNKSNLFLDKVISKLWMPCKYASEGCMQAGFLISLASHEIVCLQTPSPCGIANCSWVGGALHMRRHVEQMHPQDIVNNKTTASCPNLLESWPNISHTRLILAYSNLFWLQFYSKGDSFFSCVKLVGPKDDSICFMYCIDFHIPAFSKDNILQSINYVQSTDNATDNTEMPLETFGRLIDDDGSVSYTVSISKRQSYSVKKIISITCKFAQIYCGICLLIHFAKKLNFSHLNGINSLLILCASTVRRDLLSVSFTPWLDIMQRISHC